MFFALFRIKNSTGGAILWSPNFYYSCNSSWSERAGVAINGSNVWDSTGENCGVSSNTTVEISVPPNQTSTIIFSSPSTVGTQIDTSSVYVRYVNLAFATNSLSLLTGLEYVDDLDSVTGTLW